MVLTRYLTIILWSTKNYRDIYFLLIYDMQYIKVKKLNTNVIHTHTFVSFIFPNFGLK